MNLSKKLLLILAAAGIVSGLGACEKGPMEKAGEKIDKAGKKVGDKVDDAVR